MIQKWHMRRGEGFLKIHVGADVKTKKIIFIENHR